MKVFLQFKDDGANPGILHCEAIIEFDLEIKNTLKALQKLQESNIPGAIAQVLSKNKPTEES